MVSPALTAPLTPALTGAAMCAVSFAASAASAQPRTSPIQPVPVLQIKLPKLPNIKVPDINIDLPGGLPKLPNPLAKKKNKEEPSTAESETTDMKAKVPKKIGPTKVAQKQSPVFKGSSGSVPVKVRVSSAVRPGTPDAPTFGQLPGKVAGAAPTGAFQRFPSRRMPGANMEGWKTIASGMKSRKK